MPVDGCAEPADPVGDDVAVVRNERMEAVLAAPALAPRPEESIG
jgi:hypothetical protein